MDQHRRVITGPAADFEHALAAQITKLIEKIEQGGALIAGGELRAIPDKQVLIRVLGLELLVVALAFSLDVFLDVRW